jgi:hypothetical protein
VTRTGAEDPLAETVTVNRHGTRVREGRDNRVDRDVTERDSYRAENPDQETF